MPEFLITCDGGSRGNGAPNSEGYGSFLIQLLDESQQLNNQLTFGTGITNNEAEYMSLIAALEHIATAFRSVAGDLKTIDLTVRMDSQLVIGQMAHDWKVKATNLIPLAVKAKSMISEFGSVRFEKISGEEMKTILGH